MKLTELHDQQIPPHELKERLRELEEAMPLMWEQMQDSLQRIRMLESLIILLCKDSSQILPRIPFDEIPTKTNGSHL